ncbi:MAG: glutamine-hydrolyzing GMP synthase, partial [Bdellovibrionales bacterium]|nr:glutamine-hydrolyzing GMP synthase [Bdellovibrionales bacterium]
MLGGFLVLDFGSQYTQLIARRLREFGVYSELLPYDIDLKVIQEKKPAGIILSGGPSSVTAADSPQRSIAELEGIAPVLGICYGMQLMAHQYGGTVVPAQKREYGLNTVEWSKAINNVPRHQKVWMSHGDVIEDIPKGFQVIGMTDNHPAAMKSSNLLGFQFHPEVSHTEFGEEVLRYFVFDMCQAQAEWDSPHIAEHLIDLIRETVPENENVLCALSGGVDSTVVGTLLTRALGSERVHCVFVDNGLLRKNEFSEVLALYKQLGLNVHGVDASEHFLQKLAHVEDPEAKRKIIGHTFIEVFKKEIAEDSQIAWLAQGTLYPDVIESVSLRGTNV